MNPRQEQFSAPGFWADPVDFFSDLRRDEPVFELPGDGSYMLSRYDDVKAASARPAVFSSRRPRLGEGDPEYEAIEADSYPVVATLPQNDPPVHTRFRKLVNRAFAPNVVAALDASIREIANSIVDDFGGRTTVDFCRDFADVLPSYVMADWLGVPRSEQVRFKAWSDDIVETTLTPNMSRERMLETRRTYADFQKYFADIIEDRRVSPRADAVSLLVGSRVDDERPLDVPEILDILRAFLVAGNDTTANLLSGAMLLLLDHPDTFAEVRADRAALPKMIEEALRYVSPAQVTMRTLVADEEMSGCPMRKDRRARLVLASANRDEKQFADPHTFDIHRDTSGHLAFGHGVHYCIGHLLARAEAKIAFEVLFDRLEDIRLAGPRDEVRRKPMPGVFQLAGLDLTFRYSTGDTARADRLGP
ncbi:monooxygenase YjiB [Pseudonocardia ailaonensis]|uniref:Monooxygenase YjiB n=1 Tax=Pseudonocardia ailaonensis TaxID=367279 RepID=A0ABN2NHY2_9PSEU